MSKREKPKRLKRAQHWLCNAQKKFEKCKHDVSDAALRITQQTYASKPVFLLRSQQYALENHCAEMIFFSAHLRILLQHTKIEKEIMIEKCMPKKIKNLVKLSNQCLLLWKVQSYAKSFNTIPSPPLQRLMKIAFIRCKFSLQLKNNPNCSTQRE